MPAPKNKLKAALQRGEVQIGLWMAFAHPVAAEIAATAGYDWCLIDGEHGPNDIPLILSQLQVIADRVPVVLRLPVGQTHLIKQALDLGIQTLVVPMVDTPEQAEELVRAVRYPGRGVRGVGAAQARATNYGEITDYVTNADDEICLIVQMESRTSLENIEAIAAVDGVDAVFIGPSDLAASMGYLGKSTAPEVVEAVGHAAERILAAGKAVGMITFDANGIAPCLDMGASFMAVGGDIASYARGVRSRAIEAREIVEGHAKKG
ncbi:hypothetical protein LCGC14_2234100 [marine sediment metagenome]|uniref:HpcH/HpaI aldolase/citrate lyase domain-containing protein n=1 Tax=marine sediment metagenome TaxID=412755 RepID=A0A0F9D7K8_9ZZZZ